MADLGDVVTALTVVTGVGRMGLFAGAVAAWAGTVWASAIGASASGAGAAGEASTTATRPCAVVFVLFGLATGEVGCAGVDCALAAGISAAICGATGCAGAVALAGVVF